MSKEEFEKNCERMEKLNNQLKAVENKMNEEMKRLEQHLLNVFKVVG